MGVIVTKADLLKRICIENNIVEDLKDRIVDRFVKSGEFSKVELVRITSIVKKALSKSTDIEVAKIVYDGLEQEVFNAFLEIDEEITKENPMVVRLFEGVSLNGYYKATKMVKPNYSDKSIMQKSGIKIKPHVTRNFQEKLTFESKFIKSEIDNLQNK